MVQQDCHIGSSIQTELLGLQTQIISDVQLQYSGTLYLSWGLIISTDFSRNRTFRLFCITLWILFTVTPFCFLCFIQVETASCLTTSISKLSIHSFTKLLLFFSPLYALLDVTLRVRGDIDGATHYTACFLIRDTWNTWYKHTQTCVRIRRTSLSVWLELSCPSSSSAVRHWEAKLATLLPS